MAINYQMDIEAGTTYRLRLDYVGINLTGCKATAVFKRPGNSDALLTLTSHPTAGIRILQTTAIEDDGEGQVIPVGSWYIMLRIERSQTAAMSGTYEVSVKVEFPIGSEPEADWEQPIRGTAVVLPDL